MNEETSFTFMGKKCRINYDDNSETINRDCLEFKKLNNIYYSDIFHIFVNELKQNNNKFSTITESASNRILSTELEDLNNPRFLFLELLDENNDIGLNTPTTQGGYIWKIKKKYILNTRKGLYLGITNREVGLTETASKWTFVDHVKDNSRYNYKLLLHDDTNKYIGVDISYNLIMVTEKKHAATFYVENGRIYYVKSDLRIKFETNNGLLKLSNVDRMIEEIIYNRSKMNEEKECVDTAIILAGGRSSRFRGDGKTPSKQLYEIDGITALERCILSMIEHVNLIVVVANSNEIETINELIMKYENKVIVVCNDIDCRLESMKTGIEYLMKTEVKIRNVIIHDAARPYIESGDIERLLRENEHVLYSQYILNIYNGLYKKDYWTNEIVDRNDYLELCTPLCIDFTLSNFIYKLYMDKQNRIVWEFINILDLLNIEYKLIEGKSRKLRKITTQDDLD